MNRATIETKKYRYIQMGRESLTAAQNYMTKYADVWDSGREIEWLNMVHAAEICMTKALAIAEILEMDNAK